MKGRGGGVKPRPAATLRAVRLGRRSRTGSALRDDTASVTNSRFLVGGAPSVEMGGTDEATLHYRSPVAALRPAGAALGRPPCSNHVRAFVTLRL